MVDEIFTSPLVRAKQTADMLAAGLPGKPAVKVLDALSPGHAPASVLAQLARTARRRRIALVGHEPGLGELAAHLIGAGRALPNSRRAASAGSTSKASPRAAPARSTGSSRQRFSASSPRSKSCARPVAVIINPISGTGGRIEVARERAEHAAALIAARGLEAEVFMTERSGHARELAAAALDRGVRTVVAWGGDGTVNEVASALAFRDATLAIIPSGSGNGLARELLHSARTRRRRSKPRSAAASAASMPVSSTAVSSSTSPGSVSMPA